MFGKFLEFVVCEGLQRPSKGHRTVLHRGSSTPPKAWFHTDFKSRKPMFSYRSIWYIDLKETLVYARVSVFVPECRCVCTFTGMKSTPKWRSSSAWRIEQCGCTPPLPTSSRWAQKHVCCVCHVSHGILTSAPCGGTPPLLELPQGELKNTCVVCVCVRLVSHGILTSAPCGITPPLPTPSRWFLSL